MKSILVKIKSWLLVICIFADSVAPLLLPISDVRQVYEIAETEKQGEPTDSKKEDKAESEKVFVKKLTIQLRTVAARERRFFDNQNAAATQIFLPVITPPPKANA